MEYPARAEDGGQGAYKGGAAVAERLFPILYLELDAVGLAILLIVLFSQRRTGHGSADQRYFNALVLGDVAMLALDAAMWLLDGRAFPLARALLSACSAAYYLVTPLVACFWLRYCDYRIYRDDGRLRRRRLAYGVPFLLNAALCVSSVWTGAVFYLDAANVYHRGPWFWAHGVVTLTYVLWALAVIWRKSAAGRLTRRERTYLTLFMAPPAVGVVVQWMFYGVTMLWIMVAVSILFIYINVQNQQIFSDPLTGLNNRRRFSQYLEMRAQAIQSEGRRLYALMLDLDRLKHINDTYGHAAGDRALMRMADALKRVCAERNDFLARIGGDEFVLLCLRESEDEVRQTVDRLRDCLEALNALNDEPFAVAFSAGWAEFGKAGCVNAEAVLTAADRHMYAIKSSHERSRGQRR